MDNTTVLDVLMHAVPVIGITRIKNKPEKEATRPIE